MSVAKMADDVITLSDTEDDPDIEVISTVMLPKRPLAVPFQLIQNRSGIKQEIKQEAEESMTLDMDVETHAGPNEDLSDCNDADSPSRQIQQVTLDNGEIIRVQSNLPEYEAITPESPNQLNTHQSKDCSVGLGRLPLSPTNIAAPQNQSSPVNQPCQASDPNTSVAAIQSSSIVTTQHVAQNQPCGQSTPTTSVANPPLQALSVNPHAQPTSVTLSTASQPLYVPQNIPQTLPSSQFTTGRLSQGLVSLSVPKQPERATNRNSQLHEDVVAEPNAQPGEFIQARTAMHVSGQGNPIVSQNHPEGNTVKSVMDRNITQTPVRNPYQSTSGTSAAQNPTPNFPNTPPQVRAQNQKPWQQRLAEQIDQYNVLTKSLEKWFTCRNLNVQGHVVPLGPTLRTVPHPQTQTNTSRLLNRDCPENTTTLPQPDSPSQPNSSAQHYLSKQQVPDPVRFGNIHPGFQAETPILQEANHFQESPCEDVKPCIRDVKPTTADLNKQANVFPMEMFSNSTLAPEADSSFQPPAPHEPDEYSTASAMHSSEPASVTHTGGPLSATMEPPGAGHDDSVVPSSSKRKHNSSTGSESEDNPDDEDYVPDQEAEYDYDELPKKRSAKKAKQTKPGKRGRKKKFSCEACNKDFFAEYNYLNHFSTCQSALKPALAQVSAKPDQPDEACKSSQGTDASTGRAPVPAERDSLFKNGSYNCERISCGFKTTSLEKLKEHKLRHLGIKKPGREFKCTKCDFVTDTMLVLKGHNLGAHKPYQKCPFCPMSTTKLAVYQKHMRAHKEQDYSCSRCKWPGDQATIKEHVKKFHKKKFNIVNDIRKNPFQDFRESMSPKDCRQTSSVKSTSPKDTKQATNQNAGKEIFHCVPCGYQTDRRSDFGKHVETSKHKSTVVGVEEKDGVFHCIPCPYKTKCRQFFRRHMLTAKHNENLEIWIREGNPTSGVNTNDSLKQAEASEKLSEKDEFVDSGGLSSHSPSKETGLSDKTEPIRESIEIVPVTETCTKASHPTDNHKENSDKESKSAELVTDFADFATRPYACALCFFRTGELFELKRHVKNHLTGGQIEKAQESLVSTSGIQASPKQVLNVFPTSPPFSDASPFLTSIANPQRSSSSSVVSHPRGAQAQSSISPFIRPPSSSMSIQPLQEHSHTISSHQMEPSFQSPGFHQPQVYSMNPGPLHMANPSAAPFAGLKPAPYGMATRPPNVLHHQTGAPFQQDLQHPPSVFGQPKILMGTEDLLDIGTDFLKEAGNPVPFMCLYCRIRIPNFVNVIKHFDMNHAEIVQAKAVQAQMRTDAALAAQKVTAKSGDKIEIIDLN